MTWYDVPQQQEQMQQEQQEQLKRNGSLSSYGPRFVGGRFKHMLGISKELHTALQNYDRALAAYKDAYTNYRNAYKEEMALWDEHKVLCAKLQEGYDETSFNRWQEVSKRLYGSHTDAVYSASLKARDAFHVARNECCRLFNVEHLNHAEVEEFLSKT